MTLDRAVEREKPSWSRTDRRQVDRCRERPAEGRSTHGTLTLTKRQGARGGKPRFRCKIFVSNAAGTRNLCLFIQSEKENN